MLPNVAHAHLNTFQEPAQAQNEEGPGTSWFKEQSVAQQRALLGLRHAFALGTHTGPEVPWGSLRMVAGPDA